jgi:hypothetical protein
MHRRGRSAPVAHRALLAGSTRSADDLACGRIPGGRSEMDARVKGAAGIAGCCWWCWSWWRVLVGPGGGCEGNDDYHSEMRGSGPQNRCPVVSCLVLASRVGIA